MAYRCGISKIAEVLLLQGIEQIAATESLSWICLRSPRISQETDSQNQFRFGSHDGTMKLSGATVFAYIINGVNIKNTHSYEPLL